MVAGGRQCATRSTITSTKTCSANLYRRIKRRVGRSLKRAHYKRSLVSSGKQIAHKLPRVKGSFPSFKAVPGPLPQADSPDSYRQHHGTCLYKQGRENEVGPIMRSSVENPNLVYQETVNYQSETHPRLSERDSRQAIQTRSDYSNRMVPSPQSFQSNLR